MPKQIQYTKEQIIRVALGIVRDEGAEALSARSIAKRMGCSVSPLFRAYPNMDEVLSDVFRKIETVFLDYMAGVTDYYPAFKEFGMRLIRFSREEPNLFRLLFLSKSDPSTVAVTMAEECLKQTRSTFGIDSAQSGFIFRNIWPMACGMAQLANRNPEEYTDEVVGEMLSTHFMALKMLAQSGVEVQNIMPHPSGENTEKTH